MADLPEMGEDDKAKILIVDDLPEKLLVFKTVLEDLGPELVMVRSGADALREVLHREFAVILLDVNMPDIDGFETATLIRQYKKSSHTPIIFITSYADEMQTERGYLLGAVDYILSPVVPEVLRSKVKVFVQLFEMQRRARALADERVALVQAEAAREAAEETTRRSNFLSRASRELGASLDLEEGMHRLVELLVPYAGEVAVLAIEMDDVSAVLIRSATGQLTPITIISQSPTDMPIELSSAITRVLNDGRFIQLQLRGQPPDESERAMEADADIDWSSLASAIIVPLRIADRPLGALAVVKGTSLYSARDVSTLEELASRAAIAFENARLYRSLQGEIVRSRQAEEKLQDANRRKDEFLAMLSHELRNPLAPIRNAVEVIRRVAPSDGSLNWARDIVDRQVTHLTRLVDELLDVSRISQGKIALKKEPVELGQVISHSVETVKPLIESRKHTLVIDVSPTPVWLLGDFARLVQVVANLLNNAAKYTEEGGHIELTAHAQQGQAVIIVSDDGIGIDAHLLPRIFDLFSQGERSLDRSQGGLGVGLTLVQRLVELHQGKVEAVSDGIGKGSEFHVLLPCINAVPSLDTFSNTPAAAEAHSVGARIIVVDDNADAAESIAVFLRLEGHDVRTATDGLEAVQCALAYEPDVCVIDIGLPSLNGYEVAERLRANDGTRGALLIALTGYGQKEDQTLASEAGFDHHFVKPADPSEIQAAIEKWYGEQSLGGAVRQKQIR